MLHENIKALRKEKGFSQETLAERLHVVRQTVSKWEKGLSVPDAEILMRIAEILDTPVQTLLGDPVETVPEKTAVTRQLEQLNAILAEKNNRSRRIWKTVKVFLIILLAVFLLFIVAAILGTVIFGATKYSVQVSTEISEMAVLMKNCYKM